MKMSKKSGAIGLGWRLNKEKLFKLRIERGWSQEHAAEVCEIYNVRQYIRLENGETQRPRKETLKCLANGYQIDNINDIILLPNDEPQTSDLNFYLNYKSTPDKLLDYKLNTDVNPQKLIVLGVDNMILKGYDFSWKVIWDYLGIDDELRKDGIRKYHQGAYSYQYWVKWKCDLFKKHKLHKSDFREILKDVYVVKGFYDFVKQCKNNNYSLAIVSGGVDTFLEIMIPDYRYTFSYVTINQMMYDKKGYLEDIIPTPYDFEEKVTAIENIRKDLNVSFEDTVFIGVGYNNISAVNAANLCISINSRSIQVMEGFNHNIEEPDISKALKYIH